MENEVVHKTHSIPDGFIKVQEQNGSDEIKFNLMTFGEDVLQTKFVDCIDGLKNITRRIIWFTKNYSAAKGLGRVIGDVMEYHTSGDSSVYGAIIRMAQKFKIDNTLIRIEGKTGSYFNPKGAAAPRYLTAELSDFSKDIFFNGINLKTIPMVPTKLFSAMEPKYLIPKIPMALVMGNLTVGFGFKSHIPMIDFCDVCDIVRVFADYYSKGGIGLPSHKSIAQYAVPAFPIPNLIKNRTEIYKEYAKGNYNLPIEMEGSVDIQGNAIILRTVPYISDFGSISDSLINLLKDKKCKLWDYLVTVNRYSTDVAELFIEIKRGQNPFFVLDQLKSILRYTYNWHPIFSYMRNDRAVTLNPATLTYLWYQERMISIASGLKYKQADLINRQLVLEAMLAIADHTDEVIDIIRKSETDDDAANKLYHRFENLTLNQSKIVTQQRLSILAKANKKKIESDLEQVAVDLDNTLNSFTRIHETIYNDAQYLKKKYPSQKCVVYSDEFAGCVKFKPHGIVNFRNTQELVDIVSSKSWSGNTVKEILYYEKGKHLYLIQQGRAVAYTPRSKDVCCEDIVQIPSIPKDCGNTIMISEDGYTALIQKPMLAYDPEYKLFNVGTEFYTIRRSGKIVPMKDTDLPLRKSICRGAKMDLLYAIPKDQKDLVVFHMNPTALNELRIARILYGDKLGQLKTVASGKEHILAVVPIDTNYLHLNIPSECTRNTIVEFLELHKISEMFKDGETNLIINLNRLSSNKIKLKKHPEIRSLYIYNQEK